MRRPVPRRSRNFARDAAGEALESSSPSSSSSSSSSLEAVSLRLRSERKERERENCWGLLQYEMSAVGRGSYMKGEEEDADNQEISYAEDSLLIE